MDKATWTRVIVFVLAWINAIASRYGYEFPYIGEELIATVVAAVVSIWTAWKDNDITKVARERKAKIKE